MRDNVFFSILLDSGLGTYSVFLAMKLNAEMVFETYYTIKLKDLLLISKSTILLDCRVEYLQ